jgi:hypothetical protein
MPVTSNRVRVSTHRYGLGPIRRDVAERWLASDDPRKVMYALLRLSLNGPDFAYAERMALENAFHPDVWVRRNAATALSHVARLHGSIDVDAVMGTLLSLLEDPEVVDWADYSFDELEIYMKTDRRRYMALHADTPLQHAAP